MWRDEPNYLFSNASGHDAYRQHVHASVEKANGIPDANILSTDLASLADQVAEQGVVNVPVLDRENITYERKELEERGQDRRGDSYSRTVSVIRFEVPFAGDAEIFRIRPATFTTSLPIADVERTALKVTVPDSGDAAKIQEQLSRTLDSIEQYLGWHRELWQGAEEEIRRGARQKLDARHQRLEVNQAADDGLSSLGFKPKS